MNDGSFMNDAVNKTGDECEVRLESVQTLAHVVGDACALPRKRNHSQCAHPIPCPLPGEPSSGNLSPLLSNAAFP